LSHRPSPFWLVARMHLGIWARPEKSAFQVTYVASLWALPHSDNFGCWIGSGLSRTISNCKSQRLSLQF
jgi:hypothetical protein